MADSGSRWSAGIRTPDQRLRVFVSSTLGELGAERGAARAAIEQLRLVPVVFEAGAPPPPAQAVATAYPEQSYPFVRPSFDPHVLGRPGLPPSAPWGCVPPARP